MQQKVSSLEVDPSSIEGVAGRSFSNVSPHSTTETVSDNETSEKPVREKLKKASLASISNNSLSYSSPNDALGDDGSVPEHINARRNSNCSFSLTKHNDDNLNNSRGRTQRKRSLDGSEMRRNYLSSASENKDDRNETPMRKGSSNVRHSDLEDELCTQTTRTTPGSENNGRSTSLEATTIPSKINFTNCAPVTLPTLTKDSEDLDMSYSIFGPRKKRSRDQLDADIDREQKIVATEEAKAQRRSEENERDGQEKPISTDANIHGSTGTSVSNYEDGGLKRFPNFKTSEISKEDNIILIDSADVNTAPSSTREPLSAPFQTKELYSAQISTSKFTASGFAALAGTSTSPFSTLGFSSKISKVNPTIHVDDCKERSGNINTQAEHAILNAINPATQGLGALGTSASSISGSSNFNSLGGIVFGSGFGQASNGGTKLTSFAAPVGDAKWGDQSGSQNTFGAPANEEEEEEEEEEDNSESEEYGSAETENNDESCEVDCRFQQQDFGTGEDGEETVFSSPRAGLFSWNGTAWKEGGKGVFKLNLTVPGSEPSENFQRSGRFIMRAHQTFRVLLNTPVFKQMKIGDSKGNEPTGKSLSFSVVEKGKPTPYLIRLNDENESRKLYHAVRKLQVTL